MRIPKPLTKNERKKLVRIAWQKVNEFIRDWHKSPFEYSTERDIQADIANRIKEAYRKLNKHTLFARYRRPWVSEEDEQAGQICNRVSCEPPTYYKGTELPCKPDIVIYDDLKDPENPPDQNKKTGRKRFKNWKMLWVCEIKHRFDPIKKDIGEKAEWDLEKLRCLHKRKDAENGCWLNIHRSRIKKGKWFKKKPITKDGKFLEYTVVLSPFKI